MDVEARLKSLETKVAQLEAKLTENNSSQNNALLQQQQENKRIQDAIVSARIMAGLGKDY